MGEPDIDARKSNFGLRMRRSRSWSDRANEFMSDEDFDSAFLFYWIAFNALYSKESTIGTNTNERETRISDRQLQSQFIDKIQRFDKEDGCLYEFLWDEYSNSIRNLLDNKYIFGSYWQDIQESPEESAWANEMRSANRSALQSMRDSGSFGRLLNIVFSRLNILRNQIAHGSSTYKGSLNREQVKTGATFMHRVVPIFQQLFNENPDADWGEPPYPPQDR